MNDLRLSLKVAVKQERKTAYQQPASPHVLSRSSTKGRLPAAQWRMKTLSLLGQRGPARAPHTWYPPAALTAAMREGIFSGSTARPGRGARCLPAQPPWKTRLNSQGCCFCPGRPSGPLKQAGSHHALWLACHMPTYTAAHTAAFQGAGLGYPCSVHLFIFFSCQRHFIGGGGESKVKPGGSRVAAVSAPPINPVCQT